MGRANKSSVGMVSTRFVDKDDLTRLLGLPEQVDLLDYNKAMSKVTAAQTPRIFFEACFEGLDDAELNIPQMDILSYSGSWINRWPYQLRIIGLHLLSDPGKMECVKAAMHKFFKDNYIFVEGEKEEEIPLGERQSFGSISNRSEAKALVKARVDSGASASWESALYHFISTGDENLQKEFDKGYERKCDKIINQRFPLGSRNLTSKALAANTDAMMDVMFTDEAKQVSNIATAALLNY